MVHTERIWRWSPHSQPFKEHFRKENVNKWRCIFNLEEFLMEYEAMAQSVNGHVVQLPHLSSIHKITKYMHHVLHDCIYCMHLSHQGRAHIASLIQDLVSNV
uniref:Uncharacterized protein n=1 Tax=Ditylum brightwellii TaxID=49249 RepID=A0A7S4R9P9_9STRA|mmetsp:Transcript_13713/g.19190  ORF Transcript_13713/g.19190 Transcript_13713/m.19190 type:complete len:102 (+) Transcript_13713:362-667(+)